VTRERGAELITSRRSISVTNSKLLFSGFLIIYKTTTPTGVSQIDLGVNGTVVTVTVLGTLLAGGVRKTQSMGIVKHEYGNRPEKRQQQLLSLEVTEKTRPLD
jgi:hypothetical protein